MIKILETIFSIIIEILMGLFKAIFDVFGEIFSSKPEKKLDLDADFFTGTGLLSSSNKGFSVTGNKAITTAKSYENMLLLGGSGSGKSSRITNPTIYNLALAGHSLCIHDPSASLFKETSGYFHKMGYDIKVVHYARPEVSDGYNPLARIKSQSDINKMATILIKNSLGDKDDAFWSNSAISFLSIVISVLKIPHNSKYANIANLKYLVDSFQSKPDAWDKLVIETGDRKIYETYKSLLTSCDKKVLQGVISTAKAALQLFDDPSIQAITSFDSLDFEKMRKNKTAIFIQNKTTDLKYYSVLTSIFFEQLFGEIMTEIPSKNDKSIFVILEECSELKIPVLPAATANVRKYNCGIQISLQYFGQLKNNYTENEAEAIKANCFVKCYLPNAPLDTCKELSTLLGSFQYLNDKEQKQTRLLMTPDEIRTMEDDQALILCGRYRPILAKTTPYYKHFNYKRYSRIPAIQRISKLSDNNVKLIPMPTK